ncbi:quinolinate synthase NadA [Tessaracoccus sp. HDW20]|uniref:quinolinate synthase NadA n=1 Tax=Tessaracoccus coleopterorum TaxID=2714950 RepID=UPI0018D3BC2E|nr:quinolinate synthase NadA [Tessaracoccus coleopterorum]NHB85879.1 quinolinate synthase NadA [Tessaracoccus coleopterorum]
MRDWKRRFPDAVVVSYVNTTAEVKALTDVCCTSSNAVEVVRSIPRTARSCSSPTSFWARTCAG